MFSWWVVLGIVTFNRQWKILSESVARLNESHSSIAFKNIDLISKSLENSENSYHLFIHSQFNQDLFNIYNTHEMLFRTTCISLYTQHF